MLENPLPQIPSEKQRVSMARRDSGEEAEFGRAKVLRLVNHDMIERLGGFVGETRRKHGKNRRPGRVSLRLQCRAHRSKDWPQTFALLGAKPALPAHALHGDIIIERLDAPGVNDVHPFGKQEAIRKALHIGGGSRSHDPVTKQRLRRDARADAKFELMQLISDALKRCGRYARHDGAGIGRKHRHLRSQRVSERL